ERDELAPQVWQVGDAEDLWKAVIVEIDQRHVEVEADRVRRCAGRLVDVLREQRLARRAVEREETALAECPGAENDDLGLTVAIEIAHERARPVAAERRAERWIGVE